MLKSEKDNFASSSISYIQLTPKNAKAIIPTGAATISPICSANGTLRASCNDVANNTTIAITKIALPTLRKSRSIILPYSITFCQKCQYLKTKPLALYKARGYLTKIKPADYSATSTLYSAICSNRLRFSFAPS